VDRLFFLYKIQKKIIENSKNKMFSDTLVCYATYYSVKLRNLNFDFFCIKSLEKGKMALTFAYDVEKKRIIYQNDRGKKLHPILPGITWLGNF
jgi:hypothetical protein